MDISTDSPQRFGYPALFAELEAQGIQKTEVEKRAGLDFDKTDLEFHERVTLFKTAQSMARRIDTALLAGQRQEISYYGPYGYLMATSSTLADAFRLGREFFSLSGSVLRISLKIENGVGVFRSHEPESLGTVLPFVAEYWRSSQSRLFSLMLGRSFPSISMKFPYESPKHAAVYADVFNCSIEFGSEIMEWRFDADALLEPCVHADNNTAKLCEDYCEQFISESGGKSSLQREILRVCVTSLATNQADARSVAKALNMSVRTLYRKLDSEGTNFKSLVDRLRSSVAIEYLTNTTIPVEEIATRCGYQDVSNFRKAFRRWTGAAPSAYRQ